MIVCTTFDQQVLWNALHPKRWYFAARFRPFSVTRVIFCFHTVVLNSVAYFSLYKTFFAHNYDNCQKLDWKFNRCFPSEGFLRYGGKVVPLDVFLCKILMPIFKIGVSIKIFPGEVPRTPRCLTERNLERLQGNHRENMDFRRFVREKQNLGNFVIPTRKKHD